MTDGFLDGYEQLGGRFLRFEDLVSGEVDFTDLALYLEVSGFDLSVLQRKVGFPDVNQYKARWKRVLTPPERLIISMIGGSTLKRLEYG